MSLNMSVSGDGTGYVSGFEAKISRFFEIQDHSFPVSNLTCKGLEVVTCPYNKKRTEQSKISDFSQNSQIIEVARKPLQSILERQENTKNRGMIQT